MITHTTFRTYLSSDRESCLAIFDANTPKFFAVNERLDYSEFLDSVPERYEVCLSGDSVIAAFGLIGNEPKFKNLNWILISPQFQGSGVGSKLINRVVSIAHKEKLDYIKIAASHLSAPFFAKYGAKPVLEIKDGWGPDMHRIDMELHL